MLRTTLLLSFVVSNIVHAGTGDCRPFVEPRALHEVLRIEPRFTIEYSASGRFACAGCDYERWTPSFDVHLSSLRFSSIVLTDLPEFDADARLRPAQRVILQAFGKVAAGARVIVLSKTESNVSRAIRSLAITSEILDLEAWGLAGEALSYRPRPL